MSRFNTGNPLDSDALQDLSDNAKNADLFSNDVNNKSYKDRFGRIRKTIHGMESEFNRDQKDRDDRFKEFILSSGYQFVGDYAAGVKLTEYNQLVRDENGEFWRVSGQVDLPYVTTGAGIVEEDAFIPAGDAALRSEIAQPESSVIVGGITAKRIGDSLNELGVRNAKFRDKYSGKVNLCAHRGREYAPENTAQGINALPPECNFIEFDVRLTSDGVPVCIHDPTVDRTTNGSGFVTDFTFAQIRELDAGSWYADDYAGIKIPTLREYIEASKRKGVEVLLMQDYSTPNANNATIIYEVLKDMNALDMVVYMASSNEQITVIRDNCPDVLLGSFSATAPGRFDLLRANNGILALTPPGDNNVITFKDFYKTAKEAGMVTGASTTNNPLNVERGYEEFGCDLILTDFVSTYTKYRG